MSETVPSDTVMEAVDRSLDYTSAWRQMWGLYFREGKQIVSVALGDCVDEAAEAVTVSCLGVSRGADQAVWVASAMSAEQPVGEPHLVLVYSDRWGSAAMRRRRLSIQDDGTVVGAGTWRDRPTDESRLVKAMMAVWPLEPGDPAPIERLLKARGHRVA